MESLNLNTQVKKEVRGRGRPIIKSENPDSDESKSDLVKKLAEKPAKKAVKIVDKDKPIEQRQEAKAPKVKRNVDELDKRILEIVRAEMANKKISTI
jgi:hypothetical protein